MRIIAMITGLFMLFSASAFAADFKAAVSIIPQKYLADKITGRPFRDYGCCGQGLKPS
ncbi:MAG: hypothetical protein LRY50_16735 [Geovibrio sp.]|nr:hypothetical protein [Geovibrio sp.]